MLQWAGLKSAQQLDYATLREEGIERIANAVEEHLDMTAILDLL